MLTIILIENLDYKYRSGLTLRREYGQKITQKGPSGPPVPMSLNEWK